MEDLKEMGGIVIMFVVFILWMIVWGNHFDNQRHHPKDHDMGTFENYDGRYP